MSFHGETFPAPFPKVTEVDWQEHCKKAESRVKELQYAIVNLANQGLISQAYCKKILNGIETT